MLLGYFGGRRVVVLGVVHLYLSLGYVGFPAHLASEIEYTVDFFVEAFFFSTKGDLPPGYCPIMSPNSTLLFDTPLPKSSQHRTSVILLDNVSELHSPL
jgi:hypothetical protein